MAREPIVGTIQLLNIEIQTSGEVPFYLYLGLYPISQQFWDVTFKEHFFKQIFAVLMMFRVESYCKKQQRTFMEPLTFYLEPNSDPILQWFLHC